MNLVERFRGHVVQRVLSVPTFAETWPVRRQVMQDPIGGKMPSNPRHLVGMGSYLADAFKEPAMPGRGQGALSASGVAWHCLLTYYLNVVYAGTDAVAVTESTAPRSLQDALKVSYGGTSVEGDLDVALIVLPGAGSRDDPLGAAPEDRRQLARKAYWDLFDADFRNAYVCLIACKSNWNDTVQVPMLWNFIYSLRSVGGVLSAPLAVGSGGYSLDQLQGFSNAFMTVPTNALDAFKPTAMPVQRARTMSGGYFWGYPTRPGVCWNISDFLDFQASKSNLVPPASRGGAGFVRELETRSNEVDLDAFEWF